MTRTVLIDADIVAYQASAGNQRSYDWGDGVVSQSADLKAAKRQARDTIDELAERLKATDVVVCLSDDVNNFRKRIYPQYKEHRKSTARPVHLYDIKEWMGEAYTTAWRPWLEADDVMGIMSTEPHKGDRIIVSADKDMQTVPGLLFNPGKDTKVRSISREESELFMLWQALTGDATDGYPGCPGCGKVAADKLIYQQHVWRGLVREITRGKRKGEIETTWTLDMDDYWRPWAAVLSAYDKAGSTPAEAIRQVNLARILKHEDVDGNRVIPWVSGMLSSEAN